MDKKYIGDYYNPEMVKTKECSVHNTKLSIYEDDKWGIIYYCEQCNNEFILHPDGSYSVIS